MWQIDKTDAYVMNTYRRYPLVIERGEGSYVFDADGRRYLDFIAGIAVCSLGHSPQVVRDALAAQSATLVHTSNLFYTGPQAELAELLVKSSLGAAKAFFCNSGAEANEAAIKLARKYQYRKGSARREIVTFTSGFHGRTLGALTATAQPKFHVGFDPLLPGFAYANLNDRELLRAAVTDRTAAIMLELIQAEGGVNHVDLDFLSEIRALCDEQGILLILDEVQTGMGRTGTFCAYEQFGIEPDIITFAKGIAGGLPMGAMLAKETVADAFEPGDHASTFGGTPLVAAVAHAVVSTIVEPGFLVTVRENAQYLRGRIDALRGTLPVTDVRGLGLLVGVQLDLPDPAKLRDTALANGLLVNMVGGNVARLVPPLTVTKAEIDEFIEKFSLSVEGART